MMNGDHRLLRASNSDTLGSLSSAQSVSVGDLWLPLAALLPRRAKDDTPVPIPPHTPIVLLDHSTGRLVTRRQDILTLIPILFVNEANLAIPPNAVPPNCTVFVRATKHMSKKHVLKGTEFLHRPITAAQAVAEGSALREQAPTPSSARCGHSAKAPTPSSAVPCGADTEHRPKRARSDAVFDTYLSEALKGRGCDGRGGALIAETMANIARVRGAPPLHFVTHGKAHTSLCVGGLSWNMLDERVLCRVFRRGREADGGKCTYSDAARLIAVFLIDGVLMQRAAVTMNGHAAWTLADADLPATVRALRERGYRVVLLDHYPSLHHGNAVALDAKLLPITELCQKYIECDVTVAVSTMSYISAAHRRDGMSFVFPYSGLWQFFISQLNGGIRVDDHSLLVGAAPLSNVGELSDISSQHHRDVQLAANCGLRFLDTEQIKKETIAA